MVSESFEAQSDHFLRDDFFFEAFFFAAFFFGAAARSGRMASPVSRFHSSNVSGEISPETSISANFRRCA